MDDLPFPVSCDYPGCGEGPFETFIEVDEHITEVHLAQAVWSFAIANMKSVPAPNLEPNLELTAKESGTLALIAAYCGLKRARIDFEEMIEGLGPQAKRIARILLDGDATGATADEKAAAIAYRINAKINTEIGGRRRRKRTT